MKLGGISEFGEFGKGCEFGKGGKCILGVRVARMAVARGSLRTSG